MPRASLNLNFNERIVINASQLAWVGALAPRVWHKQFERELPGRGRSTSLVRCQTNAFFEKHTHPMGEEVLVLDGVYADEHGEYPAGTYLRYPPGSAHKPYSETGCILFVKVDHFQEGDDQRVVIREDELNWTRHECGCSMATLHSYGEEHTALVKWSQGQCPPVHSRQGGEEILILEGDLADEHGTYPSRTWIRYPHLSEHNFVSEEGALVFIKNCHLPSGG